jgi:hypothetical protein
MKDLWGGSKASARGETDITEAGAEIAKRIRPAARRGKAFERGTLARPRTGGYA